MVCKRSGDRASCFLNPRVLDGGDWSAACSGCIGKNPWYCYVGIRVDPSASLEMLAKEKFPLCQDSNPGHSAYSQFD